MFPYIIKWDLGKGRWFDFPWRPKFVFHKILKWLRHTTELFHGLVMLTHPWRRRALFTLICAWLLWGHSKQVASSHGLVRCYLLLLFLYERLTLVARLPGMRKIVGSIPRAGGDFWNVKFYDILFNRYSDKNKTIVYSVFYDDE